MTTTPKIYFFDCETSPMEGYFFHRYGVNVYQPQVKRESHLLCWHAKDWITGERVHDSLHEYETWEEDLEEACDYNITSTAWDLFDKADILIGHNIKDFDDRVLKTRFIVNGFTPPSPYKLIDTKIIAKRSGRFSSNKLEDLCIMLGIGRKKGNEEGFNLWRKCMEGDLDAWDKMNVYCKNDVDILDKLYERLLPWTPKSQVVNLGMLMNKPVCPTCGSDHVQSRGEAVSNAQVYQRFHCQDCGHWFRGYKKAKETPTNYRSI